MNAAKPPGFIPRAALATVRNAVPVAGVFAFGWSPGMVALDYWFDGVTLLAALIAVILPPLVRETRPSGGGALSGLLAGVLAGVAALALLGIPFWFALFALHFSVITPEIWSAVLGAPAVLVGFAGIALGNLLGVLQRGHAGMPRAAMTRSLHWEFHLLLYRVLAMLLAAFVVPGAGVAVLALMLIAVELFPLPVLRFFGAPLAREDAPPSA